MQNFSQVQCIVENALLYTAKRTPRVGIVLGTGLGGLADALEDVLPIPYAALPGFPLSTVASHAGRFLLGTLAGPSGRVEVMLQQGRCHLYEGYSPAAVCTGVRVMAGLGVQSLVITNAAGALNPRFDAGDLMVITDHINKTGQSPLTGENYEAWGPRFPDMSCAYDPDYVRLALHSAAELGMRVERGVYIGVPGPQMETPAETRYYRQIGADAVGMSTVLEVLAARHMGLRVLGISCLTNKNLPDCMKDAPLEEVIRVATAAGDRLTALVRQVAASL